MKVKVKESARAWLVRYTKPTSVNYGTHSEPRIHRVNYCSVVVAATVERAVEMMMREFSEATIISVNPGSTGPIVIDELVVELWRQD